jgi:hypothetical protein
MFDLSTIKSKNEFPYWFVRQGISNNFDIYANVNCEFRTKIGICHATDDVQGISLDDEFLDCDMNVIKEAFSLFYHRPEYIVGIPLPAERIETTGTNACDL